MLCCVLGLGEVEKLIGTLGASPNAGGEVEFGYSILPAFQRRGYGHGGGEGICRLAVNAARRNAALCADLS